MSTSVDLLLARTYGSVHDPDCSDIDRCEDFYSVILAWLRAKDYELVEEVFARLDFGRCSGVVVILLLSATRLLDPVLPRRGAFIDRFGKWLLDNTHRSEQDVNDMLRGFRP